MQGTVTLVRQPMKIPEQYEMGDTTVVPMWAGQELSWRLALTS